VLAPGGTGQRRLRAAARGNCAWRTIHRLRHGRYDRAAGIIVRHSILLVGFIRLDVAVARRLAIPLPRRVACRRRPAAPDASAMAAGPPA
jgi:hypothetical protein